MQVFYSLSVTGVGIFSTATWIYATQNRRLVDAKISDDEIRHIRQESYIEPIVSLLAVGGALIAPWGWTATLSVGLLFAYLIYFALKRSPEKSSQ